MSQFHLLQSKEQLRKECKNIRINLYNSGQLKIASEEITKKISETEDFLNAKCVMLFYPKKHEINVLSLLDFNKKFYLPRCENNEIVVCEYKKGDILKKNSFNVYEPVNKSIDDLSVLDLIIVPALCIDKKGNRLGYGGGFYDRFLKNTNIKAKTFTVAPKELLFENIENEEFDVKCNKIISA